MNKVVSQTELQAIVRNLHSRGKKVVFTNGCFDLLHVGHIRYLSEAGKLGDVLVIGLNSDRSVSAIKPGRPLTPQEERAEIMAALEDVDYVTLFDEETPYELISLIKPDVLVKGADWKKEDIVGNDLVQEVRTIPVVEGRSTSSIIAAIKKLP